MMNFSKTTLSPVEDGPQYGDMDHNNSSGRPDVHDTIAVFTSCISIIGLVGNGLVIYLLGFHIKRSPFTTFIVNLAVADFGVLPFGNLILISLLTDTGGFLLYTIAFMAVAFTYNASQLLLTAISIDRCVSVLFPIWHRCHRPPDLSTMVCALMWVLACLPSGSLAISYHFNPLFHFPFIVGAVLCLPLVTVSTMILLFQVFCKSWQHQKGRCLTIVLLTLIFFLIFAFPLNVIATVNCCMQLKYEYLVACVMLCASLNSCVKPAIYFMVGRKKRGQQRQSLKVLLQRAFKEEEEHRGLEHQSPDVTMRPSS